MKILVSACLLDQNCRYNGKSSFAPGLAAFLQRHQVVGVCPELLAGMPTPRPCAELADGAVMDENGNNVDARYRQGVRLAMEKVKGMGIDLAVLQARSPTCGVGRVYDGSFTGRLTKGSGLFAQALREAGCRVLNAEDLP